MRIVPLYPCSEPGCADEISYWASDLRVHEGKPYCEACWTEILAPVYANDEDAEPIAWHALPPFVPESDRRIDELEQQLKCSEETGAAAIEACKDLHGERRGMVLVPLRDLIYVLAMAHSDLPYMPHNPAEYYRVEALIKAAQEQETE